MNREPFGTDRYYHVYNRGVDKRNVFQDEEDFLRFLQTIERIRIFGSSKGKGVLPEWIPIVAYCLNPNHFHFILRQTTKADISRFMQKLCTSYTKYFNYKYRRSGALLETTFKSSRIDSESYLSWVSSYVNSNAELHGITLDARTYRWCSFPEYLSKSKKNIVDDFIVLNQFNDSSEYEKFVREQISRMKLNQALKQFFHE